MYCASVWAYPVYSSRSLLVASIWGCTLQSLETHLSSLINYHTLALTHVTPHISIGMVSTPSTWYWTDARMYKMCRNVLYSSYCSQNHLKYLWMCRHPRSSHLPREMTPWLWYSTPNVELMERVPKIWNTNTLPHPYMYMHTHTMRSVTMVSLDPHCKTPPPLWHQSLQHCLAIGADRVDPNTVTQCHAGDCHNTCLIVILYMLDEPLIGLLMKCTMYYS